MTRSLALLLIGLVFGGGIGFVVAAGTGATLDGHEHAAQVGHDASGGHADHDTPHAVPAGTDAPTLKVALTPDPVSGWNIRLRTTNFSFAPERAGHAHVPGQGHAHVYVDGEKIARLYGRWMHIPALNAGSKVLVTLNANDHRPLSVGSDPVSATVTVASN
jgi:hypothetical protein